MWASILSLLATVLSLTQEFFSARVTKEANTGARASAEIARQAQQQVNTTEATDAANAASDLERLHDADSLSDQRAIVQAAIDRANAND